MPTRPAAASYAQNGNDGAVLFTMRCDGYLHTMRSTPEHIVDIAVIPRDCAERFLPLRTQDTALLAEQGVQMAGVSDVGADYEMGRTNLPFHLLLYTAGGTGRLIYKGQERLLAPGDLFFAPVSSAHAYAAGGSKWRIAWFHLEDSPGWRFLREQQQHVRQARELQALLPAMEGYCRESRLRSRNVDASSAAAHYAKIIIILLKRELQHYADARVSEVQNRFCRLWDEVEASLGRPWTVRSLAERMHVSEVQFHRLCREHCGVTPMAYVRSLRMQRACYLLGATTLPVKHVAYLTGYADPLAFSAAFRRHASVAPRAYRAQAGVNGVSDKRRATRGAN